VNEQMIEGPSILNI